MVSEHSTWAASVTHQDDGKILGLCDLPEVPDVGQVIVVDGLPYIVKVVDERDETEGTVALTVDHPRDDRGGGWRRIGM